MEKFKKIARWYAISHFIAGTLYIPFHKVIPLICNHISDFLGLPLQMLPLPSEKFWFSLSVSMMYMIAFSAFYSSTSPSRIHAWPVIIVSKGVSTFFFLVFFFVDVKAFVYIVGILVDFPLFLIALYTWVKYKDAYPSAS